MVLVLIPYLHGFIYISTNPLKCLRHTYIISRFRFVEAKYSRKNSSYISHMNDNLDRKYWSSDSLLTTV